MLRPARHLLLSALAVLLPASGALAQTSPPSTSAVPATSPAEPTPPVPAATPAEPTPAVPATSPAAPYVAPTLGSAATVPPPRPDAAPTPAVVPYASLERGFGIESGDGRFGVRLGAENLYRAELNQTSPDHWQGQFNLWMVRPQLRMHAFGQKLRFFFQPEFAGTGAKLLDLEMTYVPHEAFGIRGGQFMTPFSRQWLTPIPVLGMVDFGAANDYFRWGRDDGVMFFGTPMHGKLEYFAGVFNGNGINQPTNQRVHGLGVARLGIAPLGAVPYDQTVFLARSQPLRFALAANGYAGRVTPYHQQYDPVSTKPVTVADPDQRNLTGGLDFALFWNRLYFLTEAYYRQRTVFTAGSPTTDSWGMQAQVGYYIAPIHLELQTRFNYVDPNVDVHHDWLATYEGEINYYVAGNHAKLMLHYLHANAGSHFASPGSISTYFPGKQERLMLQAQIFF